MKKGQAQSGLAKVCRIRVRARVPRPFESKKLAPSSAKRNIGQIQTYKTLFRNEDIQTGQSLDCMKINTHQNIHHESFNSFFVLELGRPLYLPVEGESSCLAETWSLQIVFENNVAFEYLCSVRIKWNQRQSHIHIKLSQCP